MVAPISALANMEYALYGGLGMNSAVPNYLNGYRDSINMYDSLANSYAYMNPWMYNNSAYDVNSAMYAPNGNIFNPNVATQNSTNTQNSAANEADINKLSEYYANNLDEKQSLGGAIMGMGVAGAVISNPRMIAHPINTVRATFFDKGVKEMFKDVRKDGSMMNRLWKENHIVMEDAYFRMNKLEARNHWKIGLFRKRYTPEEYNKLKTIMQDALNTGDINKVAEASAKLEQAYVNNGGFYRLLDKLGIRKIKTVESAVKDNKAVAEGAKKLIEGKNVTFTKALKKSGAWGAVLFAGLELLSGIGKIKTAFSKDKETGMKQLGQTTVKAVGNAAGWALGEAAGTALGAKVGAAVGTAVCPGLGTAVGAVIGLIGGSIGMWLMGKATNALVGEDVANKVEAENLKTSEEGKAQLLQYTGQKAQEGKLDAETSAAYQRLAAQYA